MRYKIHTYPYITFSHQVTGDDQAVAPILPVSHCLILSVSHSHLLTFAHSNILIFSHSPILAFPILSFSHSQIVTPSWNRHVVPRLLFSAPLSHSPIISFTHSHILTLSHSLTLLFSQSHILPLYHSRVITLSHWLILPLSHSHIGSFSHSPIDPPVVPRLLFAAAPWPIVPERARTECNRAPAIWVFCQAPPIDLHLIFISSLSSLKYSLSKDHHDHHLHYLDHEY